VTERRDLVRLIAALAATFNREADEAMFEGYELGLCDLPVPAVKLAVGRAIRECKFMPTVAELRELSGELLPQDRAILAWDVFSKAVPRHGYTASVDFEDPLINATIRNLGGWERCCSLQPDEFDKWLRKDFERTYQALLRSGASAKATAPLIGYHDRQNAFHGYVERITEPLRIACDLPPHRDGLVQLPEPSMNNRRSLTNAAAAVGRNPR